MWMLERNPHTRQDWGASETVTDAAVGLGQLFQAMTAAVSEAKPARLGSTVDALPLLTDRVTDRERVTDRVTDDDEEDALDV